MIYAFNVGFRFALPVAIIMCLLCLHEEALPRKTEYLFILLQHEHNNTYFRSHQYLRSNCIVPTYLMRTWHVKHHQQN